MGHVLVKMALNLAIYLSSCFGLDWVQSMYDTRYCLCFMVVVMSRYVCIPNYAANISECLYIIYPFSPHQLIFIAFSFYFHAIRVFTVLARSTHLSEIKTRVKQTAFLFSIIN